jgi:hypothetical protein
MTRGEWQLFEIRRRSRLWREREGEQRDDQPGDSHLDSLS